MTLLACCLLPHVCKPQVSGFASAQEEAVSDVATLSIVQNTSALASIGAGDPWKFYFTSLKQLADRPLIVLITKNDV